MTHPYRCLATVDTPRPLARWRSWLNRWWLDAMFASLQCWRRVRGGHWELWLILYPIADIVWVQLPHDMRPDGVPGLGVRCYDCEDWS